MLHTLQEFFEHTKGIAYIFAVVIMVAFIFYWLFLVDRDSKS